MADAIAYVAGIFLMVSFLPQVYRSWRIKHTRDLSMLMLLATLISTILYQIYAIMLDLFPVLVVNCVFGVLVLIQILLKLVYDRRDVPVQNL